MTLKIAVQMDPMETVNIAGDSSFALMLSAQKRGHEIFHYDVKGLTLRQSALQLKLVAEADFDKFVQPQKMLGPK